MIRIIFLAIVGYLLYKWYKSWDILNQRIFLKSGEEGLEWAQWIFSNEFCAYIAIGVILTYYANGYFIRENKIPYIIGALLPIVPAAFIIFAKITPKNKR